MKKLVTLLSILMCAMMVWSQADTIPRLIITEAQLSTQTSGYVEITNVGDTALDLSQFGFSTASGNGRSLFSYTFDEQGNKTRLVISNSRGSWTTNPELRTKLAGILEPNESFVIMMFEDYARGTEYPDNQVTYFNNEARAQLTDFPFFASKDWLAGNPFINNPDIYAFGFDSISPYRDLLWSFNDGAYCLWYFPPQDSFVIDVVNAVLDGESRMTRTTLPVAGVEDAVTSHVFVRKSDINKGNIDWEIGRGTSAEDSEWMLLPLGNRIGDPWIKYPYTIGNHGDFSIDISSDDYTIDIPGGTMEIPWGVEKGDSITSMMNLGNGMYWNYFENTNSEDSAYTIARTGDVVEFFAFGEEREQVTLTLTVKEPTNDMAMLFPKRIRNFNALGEFTTWSQPYTVTDQYETDSIRGIAFATRIDTLLKRVMIAPGASWEVIWVDGVERPDVKHGDIIKVTAADGTTTKDYALSVRDYQPGSNANLASITWPDYPQFDLFDWVTGDTIPDFSPTRTAYDIVLPPGWKSVPALVAKPQDTEAKVSVMPAINVSGSLEDRTTSFTVTSEDDSIQTVYTVTFSVDIPPDEKQPYVGNPFISEVHYRWWWNVDALEIYNPGDEELDLSEYLILGSLASTPAEALAEEMGRDSVANWRDRMKKYVPGYLYPDFATFAGTGWTLQFDPVVDPIVEPKSTFTLSLQGYPPPRPERYSPQIAALTDVDFTNQQNGAGKNTWDDPTFNPRANPFDRGGNIWIFKIVEDSVLNGTKEVGADIDDYELVDCFGFFSAAAGERSIAGRTLNSPSDMEWRFIRKSNIFEGVQELESGFGTNAEDSDWVVDHRSETGLSPGSIERFNNFSTHQSLPVSVHLSKITSNTYKVTTGYQGLQSVRGDLSGKTVTAFYGNINKAHPDQSFEVHSSTDGSIKSIDAGISENDTLYVTSANGVNTTKYLLINSPLDNDAVLVAADGSGLTIDINGTEGSITGVQFGQDIAEVLDNVTAPATAVLTVVNGAGEILPLKKLNFDTLYVNTKVGTDVYFKVVAENGTDYILYHLDPQSLGSDAYLISDLFTVENAEGKIREVPYGMTVASFMDNVEVVKGATAEILDKYGLKRELGGLAFDDKVKVVSEDESNQKYYYIDFLTEEVLDANASPVAVIVNSDTTVDVNASVMMKSSVSDDGFPNPPALTTISWEVMAETGDAQSVTLDNPDQATTQATFTAAGTFKLAVTASDGELVAGDTIRVIVLPVGIEDNKNGSMALYPNPANSYLSVQLSNLSGMKEIAILNLVGEYIYQKEHMEDHVEIDLSNLKSGVYFVRVKSGDFSTVQKINVVK